MQPFTVPAGTQLILGAPANPMPDDIIAAIAEIVSSVDGLLEAHLPQYFAPDAMEAPAQVLVLVLAPGADPRSVVEAVGRGVGSVLPEGMPLDIWPLSTRSALLKDVRRANCSIGTGAGGGTPAAKPWWKLWG